ncbi:hypothetical protein PUNSTDRAFT_138220 [Punctularia strigosozonata HHB-11173 SS5]|uniref:CENP-V/GFA domain-containing protein n=1 Tax=Punctularia strigosozonata (strain HHB-11173) TaxID=741275 RepID=R7S491_PUNST|nr:uncharacterized protein PUNSTDRAFT_138220 [Punctularia strigosozonata HHB-11173 SS5]EIN05038.1 hypothetical protein PUNSTDRAFT_138220 [Punctularia strigosozonata HHB-11173 SS5]
MTSSTTDKTQPYFPRAGVATDGWSNDDKATATCFCGAVQLAFPISGPGLVNSFLCHCPDCRKTTASMFGSIFTVDDAYLKHLRGRENLSSWSQSATTKRGVKMTNFFCKTCGTLMYRVGEAFPGKSMLTIGTVDDFSLHETVLRPRWEMFVKYRVGWITSCVDGAAQCDTMPGV